MVEAYESTSINQFEKGPNVSQGHFDHKEKCKSLCCYQQPFRFYKYLGSNLMRSFDEETK